MTEIQKVNLAIDKLKSESGKNYKNWELMLNFMERKAEVIFEQSQKYIP